MFLGFKIELKTTKSLCHICFIDICQVLILILRMVLQNETESVTLSVNNVCDDVTDSEVCRFIQNAEI